jgi:predicted small lipoprotein YifL
MLRGSLVRLTLVLLPAAALAACGARQPPPAPPAPVVAAPPPPKPETVTVTVPVHDTALEHEAVRLRMSLLERSAQLAEATRRLDEATTDLVRAMARLRSLATRAEAASAIAEAEVTLQQLRGGSGQQLPPEARQAEAALRAGSAAFDAENYAGAVYLATQAKRIATAGRGRLAEGAATSRPGEQAFAVPVQLTTTTRTNLRAAPGAAADLVATVPPGTPLTAYAFAEDWLRVTMADGRGAWVHQSLVRGVAPGGP